MKNFHLFLIIGAALQLVAHGAPITDGVCDNPACTQEAKKINKYMKRDLNPCDDFQQFACGKFLDTPGYSKWSYMINEIQDKTKEILRQVTNPEHPKTPRPDPKDQASIRNAERMHNYFSTCMNEDAQLIKAGREPLKRELEKMVKTYSVPGSLIEPKKAPGVTIMKYGMTGQFLRSGWTTFTSHSLKYTKATGDNHKNDLSAITGQFIANGLTALAKFAVYSGSGRKTLLLYVQPSHLGLPVPSYRDNKTEKYEQLIGEMFYILYNSSDPLIGKPDAPQHVAPEELVVPPQWKDVAKKVVGFETEFAKHIPSDADSESDEFPTLKHADYVMIDEMNRRTPSLDWNVILKNALPNGVKPPVELAVMDMQDYFQELDKLLTKTDPTTIQLFFAWSMIRQYAGFLDVAHRRTTGNIRQKSNEGQDDRNLTCAKNTLQIVPDIVSHFFVQSALPKPAFGKVKEIIDSITSTYSKGFQSNQPNKPYDWLKDDTRQGALEKLAKLRQIIGYSYSGPDNRDPSSIDEFYSGLTFDGHDNFGNQVHLKTFRAQQKLRKLHMDKEKEKEIDPLHMSWTADENAAQNILNINTIQFPAGRLHSPMFNVDFPEYLNYATLGTMAGHEITHSFDDDGINYDGTGQKSNWFNSSRDALNDRTQCLVKQFSKFTIPGSDGRNHTVSGELTLSENIADNGAIDKAYDAWFERYQLDLQSKKYNNKRLPNLEEYSPQQMFFIQYARLWCSRPDPKGYESDLMDAHSPDKWRTIGVLQNSQDFARAFKCEPGSPMNPVKTKDNDTKCSVWSKTV
ncbi:MAG: hypothetical protein J3Q66DRAFT_409756 [Benniella sp.]|nr:MAG: hypothetical protein J3Q66DRAFT_409756 [Benniella sp.]